MSRISIGGLDVDFNYSQKPNCNFESSVVTNQPVAEDKGKEKVLDNSPKSGVKSLTATGIINPIKQSEGTSKQCPESSLNAPVADTTPVVKVNLNDKDEGSSSAIPGVKSEGSLDTNTNTNGKKPRRRRKRIAKHKQKVKKSIVEISSDSDDDDESNAVSNSSSKLSVKDICMRAAEEAMKISDENG